MAATSSRQRGHSLDDPLDAVLRPPPDETPEQRLARLAAAQTAERTSKQIDEILAQGKRAFDKKKGEVKILLLGQSESGKSTVLKNFRLRFTPQYFDAERSAWRVVVLLNLISSLRIVVETILAELAAPEFTLVSGIHRQRCADLKPALEQETALNSLIAVSTQIAGEVVVRPGGEWKKIFSESELAREAVAIICGMKDEIEEMWADTAVRELLEKKEVSLKDAGGYFMDDILRVTAVDFIPTDSDILRARIKTMGVEEHFFEKEKEANAKGVNDFWIYDVPGARGSRAVWIPFFDSMQAIVFLTPLSFYEVLEEDTRVNRLEDSVVLWKEICSNTLLQNCQIILFFNKMDILKAKLRAGLVVREYVTSFGDRQNNFAGATGYFKEKFRAYHKRLSPKPRNFFYYETTAVVRACCPSIHRSIHFRSTRGPPFGGIFIITFRMLIISAPGYTFDGEDHWAPRASSSSFDPLTVAIRPPQNETEEERQARMDAAREATRVSRAIDAGLAENRRALERKKRAVKILLLGQSESGKSSVLRNFRLAFTPKYFESERQLWATVIRLNLIGREPEPSRLTPEHRARALAIAPLLDFETSISQLIDAGTGPGLGLGVRPGGGWKQRLAVFAGGRSSSSASNSVEHLPEPHVAATAEAAHVSEVCATSWGDVVALWEDPVVKEVLRENGVHLEEEAGFFLDDTARIASPDYVPTDRLEGDIMRARIRTLGVEEHRFVSAQGRNSSSRTSAAAAIKYVSPVLLELVLKSIAFNMASNEIPYFDDVQAILFLAPLSFWQGLAEDPKINRVQDSLELWRDIVSNQLLARTAFILLFNKKDVLTAHIAAGYSVKKYVPSFGDRPNDVPAVTKYFRDKFSAYHRKYSPEPRPFIFYETEAIDPRSTALILAEVQEQIIRNHLKELDVV
ncbi:hypothetical protein MKEN_01113500 [Mycena kentingensis (nom. inval.)]|nr:hypothetical protein MKEN_01113500 [Mycena kentingensis (nom. inval.)]